MYTPCVDFSFPRRCNRGKFPAVLRYRPRRVKKKSPRARSRVTGLENSFAGANHRHRRRVHSLAFRCPASRDSSRSSINATPFAVPLSFRLSDFLEFLRGKCQRVASYPPSSHPSLFLVHPIPSIPASSLDPTDRNLPIDRNFQSSAGYLQRRRGFATRSRDARANVARDPLTP